MLDKAAAEEGATQGGSAGVGSQKAAEAEGEEGAIAHSTHLVTGDIHVHDSDVGTVRRKAAKKDKKENVCIADMARRVRNWGIAKPQNAQNCVWTWGFKYKNPPKCTGGFQNHALCAICLVDNLGAATVKLSKDNSPTDNLPSSQLRGIDYTPHPSHCLCFFSAAFCDPPPADPPSGAPSSAAALSSTNRLFLRQTSDAWGPQWRRP